MGFGLCMKAMTFRSQDYTCQQKVIIAIMLYSIYHTDVIISVKLIGWKDRDKTLLVDPDEIDCLKRLGRLNENAKSIYELYKHPNPASKAGSVWKDIVLSPSRLNIQQELKYCIRRIERMK